MRDTYEHVSSPWSQREDFHSCWTASWSGFLSKFEELTGNEGYLPQTEPIGCRGRQEYFASRINAQSDIIVTLWWLQLENILLLFKSKSHCVVIFHNYNTFLTLPGRLFKYLSAEGVSAIILSPEETQPTELRMVFAANSPFSKWIPICGGWGQCWRNFREG